MGDLIISLERAADGGERKAANLLFQETALFAVVQQHFLDQPGERAMVCRGSLLGRSLKCRVDPEIDLGGLQAFFGHVKTVACIGDSASVKTSAVSRKPRRVPCRLQN